MRRALHNLMDCADLSATGLQLCGTCRFLPVNRSQHFSRTLDWSLTWTHADSYLTMPLDDQKASASVNIAIQKRLRRRCATCKASRSAVADCDLTSLIRRTRRHRSEDRQEVAMLEQPAAEVEDREATEDRMGQDLTVDRPAEVLEDPAWAEDDHRQSKMEVCPRGRCLLAYRLLRARRRPMPSLTPLAPCRPDNCSTS